MRGQPKHDSDHEYLTACFELWCTSDELGESWRTLRSSLVPFNYGSTTPDRIVVQTFKLDMLDT